jgi:molybdopterin molybdotransferase
MSEFFTVRTVEEVLRGFRPSHRTAAERVAPATARGRVPVTAVRAPGALPGFARSSVDGYAVAAADTFGASEGLPAYLDVTGAVAIGTVPGVTVRAGAAVEIATGAALPHGADAVAMLEHTTRPAPDQVEILRASAPGENVVRADEDARAGDELVPAGRPLRPHDIGMLAAAGITALDVHRRPQVAIVSTGDELVAADAADLPPGRVRDANTAALAALVEEVGGHPVTLGIVPDDATRLEHVCRDALRSADVLVVSAGSSVGARDATAEVVGRLGDPGVWCHGIALKPGKPTLLAEADGRPVIGLPGNPVSALVVMRLVGAPLLRLVGGAADASPVATVRARLDRNVASATGRLDVVQVRLAGGAATPLFGKAALLSVMTRADGWITVPDEVGGLPAGADVDVTLYA